VKKVDWKAVMRAVLTAVQKVESSAASKAGKKADHLVAKKAALMVDWLEQSWVDLKAA